MNPVRFARNKLMLSRCLGISRTTLYEFLRLPDAPAPCADGRWSVVQWRKFLAKKRDCVKGSEREQLTLALLKTRLEKEAHGLAEAKRSTLDKCRVEMIMKVRSAFSMLRTELYHARVECAPRCEGQTAR